MYALLLFVVGILHAPLIEAALAITGQQCGQNSCSLNEFCNSLNRNCEKCETVCNHSSHNFDQQICEKQCQDHLHDARYGKSQMLEESELTESTTFVIDDIKELQKQQRTNTILLAIILAILLVACAIRAVHWLRKKRILSKCFLKKINPVKTTAGNAQTTVGNENLSVAVITRNGGGGGDPIVGMGTHVLSVSGTEVSTMPTLTTSIHQRYPAENSTNEYSYDNAALQVTPSTETPRGSGPSF